MQISSYTGNYHSNFGKFIFDDSSIALLEEKIKNRDDLNRYRNICNKENNYKDRIINISTKDSKLVATLDKKQYKQKFYQSAIFFLESFSKKINNMHYEKEFRKDVKNTLQQYAK